MASVQEKLSQTLERVFRITLTDGAGADEGDAPLYLAGLVQELIMEGSEPPLLVTGDNLERVLFARLSAPADQLPPAFLASDPEAAPFKWLVRSYDRCYQETRRTASRDKDFAEKVHAALAACFELCVSYCGLLLNPDMAGMFPQPPAALARGSLQLFDEMATSPDGLPPGFLEEFAARFETEGLPEMLAPVIAALPSMMQRVSPLGDFRRPMSTLCTLVAIKPIAAAVAAHPRWCPPHRANGRAFEDNSVLGPFFACAGLQDVYPPARPDVRETCFGDRRSTGDAEGAVNTLRTTVNQVQDGLYQAVYGMLRHGGDTREAVVRWLAAGVNANAGRSKIQHQPLACASHGGAANLSAVALRLAAPFADPGSRKFMKIDPNYVRSATCKLNLGEVTRVLAAADAVEAGMLPAAQEPAGWSFITECFFLTARALHLGYIKCIAEQTALPQQIQRRTHQLNDVEGMRASWASSVSAAGAGPPTPRQHQQFNNRVAELQMELVDSKDAFAAFEATLQDPRVLGETMQFYRLA
eukprot:CAMPEP_0181365752 /NCGR_PEP_ID=MMETSP1106-20121128/10275_1 /TAXON_ID=81844 /ORGANISM="Mantoniella antarctica, Strain SL-175" /LENGTH=527 /DNA_ID=CAMNT_0023480929 /DNA_START=56 /DNA_END=1636 /DNA_ORIENTATION=-